MRKIIEINLFQVPMHKFKNSTDLIIKILPILLKIFQVRSEIKIVDFFLR